MLIPSIKTNYLIFIFSVDPLRRFVCRPYEVEYGGGVPVPGRGGLIQPLLRPEHLRRRYGTGAEGPPSKKIYINITESK